MLWICPVVCLGGLLVLMSPSDIGCLTLNPVGIFPYKSTHLFNLVINKGLRFLLHHNWSPHLAFWIQSIYQAFNAYTSKYRGRRFNHLIKHLRASTPIYRREIKVFNRRHDLWQFKGSLMVPILKTQNSKILDSIKKGVLILDNSNIYENYRLPNSGVTLVGELKTESIYQEVISLHQRHQQERN